ncbi:TetR/AcrR family transcriptional regulator [Bradyrhizobium denitrificans]
MSRRKPRVDLPARARILEAATRLFTRKPFDQISAEDIAREAGVAHGLTFHYFGSKAKLYEQISQAAADQLDEIHIAATQAGTPSVRLRHFLVAHMDEVYRRRVDYVFHSRGGGTPAIQEIWERSRSNAIRLVLGFFDVKDPSPELVVATRAWLGYYDELVLAWVQGRIKAKAAIVEMAFRLFPHAVANAELLGEKNIPSI